MRRPLTARAALLLAFLSALVLGPAVWGSGAPTAAAAEPAPHASTAAAVPLRITTYNMNQFRRDDRANRVADLQRLLTRADVLLIQEAKGINVADLVSRAQEGRHFRVYQAGDRSIDQAGSVIAVRSSVLGSRGVTNFGFRFGVRGASRAECNNHAAGGHGARYIAHATLNLRNGTALPVASAHLPPPRCHGTTLEPMLKSIRSTLRSEDGRYVLGADWNYAVAERARGVWGSGTRYTVQAPGRSIDGFVLPRSMTVVEKAVELNKRPPGDHHPVRMVVRVG